MPNMKEKTPRVATIIDIFLTVIAIFPPKYLKKTREKEQEIEDGKELIQTEKEVKK
uniref:Uncharacterized protein MANES_03G000100 n=1 Tax=Rhizophora mucronata TaxID=61149 RepID=A0A2P2PQE2_RHIMU